MQNSLKHSSAKPDWPLRIGVALCAVSLALAAAMMSPWSGSTWGSRSESAVVASQTAFSASAHDSASKPIEQVRVGERVAGYNPLREQVDLIEPDAATWRRIRLVMQKPSGAQLWIELLRPDGWVVQESAQPGSKIFIDLPEMGAVGEALVTELGPCPPIPPGAGALVTGTFKHQADGGNRVLRLTIAGEHEPVRVTDNHAYWSVDRQKFIPAGELQPGELLSAESGPQELVASEPIPYAGFLYNLETTEHVYRIGDLGTLVHNACADDLRKAMNRAGVYGDAGTVPHHLVSRFDSRAGNARSILSKYGIDLDSQWNGAFLPARGSSARGAIHNSLHTDAYYNTLTARLRSADAGGRAKVLRELQKIRSELLDLKQVYPAREVRGFSCAGAGLSCDGFFRSGGLV